MRWWDSGTIAIAEAVESEDRQAPVGVSGTLLVRVEAGADGAPVEMLGAVPLGNSAGT
jgi:hypothetical protein